MSKGYDKLVNEFEDLNRMIKEKEKALGSLLKRRESVKERLRALLMKLELVPQGEQTTAITSIAIGELDQLPPKLGEAIEEAFDESPCVECGSPAAPNSRLCKSCIRALARVADGKTTRAESSPESSKIQ